MNWKIKFTFKISQPWTLGHWVSICYDYVMDALPEYLTRKRSVSQFISTYTNKIVLYLKWIKIYSMLSRIQYYKFISI